MLCKAPEFLFDLISLGHISSPAPLFTVARERENILAVLSHMSLLWSCRWNHLTWWYFDSQTEITDGWNEYPPEWIIYLDRSMSNCLLKIYSITNHVGKWLFLNIPTKFFYYLYFIYFYLIWCWWASFIVFIGLLYFSCKLSIYNLLRYFYFWMTYRSCIYILHNNQSSIKYAANDFLWMLLVF